MKEILKNATILYVEDEDKLRKYFTTILELVMKKVYVAENGMSAIEIFKEHKESIDLVVTDIEMPNLNGLELLKEIRLIDENIPCIITSAYFKPEYLHESIMNNVSGYFTKPIDTKKFFQKLAYFYQKEFNTKKLIYKEKELSDYLGILNKVAIISKTDLKGVITYANDIFCEVAKYERDELIGQPHNILRHPDMSKSVFKDMWDTIQSGRMWNGKVKNKAKDGSPYYVKASIFPIYDNDEITGYMAIRFLITEEETEKREFKKKIITNLVETRKKESDLEKANASYKDEISKLNNTVNKLTNNLNNNSNQNKQIQYYEKELISNKDKLMKILESKKQEIENHIQLNKKLKLQNNRLEKLNGEIQLNLKKSQEDNNFYKKSIVEKDTKIDNLFNIINHKN